MKKVLISEEIKRIQEIMGFNSNSIMLEAIEIPFMTRLGITGEKLFERLEKMGIKEAEAYSKEFTELAEKSVLSVGEREFLAAICRKAFPETINKFVETLERTTFRNSAAQMKEIDRLFAAPNVPTEAIRNYIVDQTGIRLEIEGVQLWRDTKIGAPVQVKLPTKTIPSAATNAGMIADDIINNSFRNAESQVNRYAGTDASRQFDNLLNDVNNHNLNVTTGQYDQMLIEFRKKIADEKLNYQKGLNSASIEKANLDNKITAQKASQDQQLFIQQMEKNELELSQNRDAFFENQERLRQERDLRGQRGNQEITRGGIEIKKAEQDVKNLGIQGDNLKAQGKTIRTEEFAKRIKIAKTIGITAVALGLIGAAAWVFLSKPAAQKAGEVLNTGLKNTGTVIRTTVMGADSTQQQQLTPKPIIKKGEADDL
jgi:hypothetical protein